METLQEKRFRFLRHLYDTVRDDEDKTVDQTELGAELGYDAAETSRLVQYLQREARLKVWDTGGQIGITHQGIKEVEQALQPPSQGTPHFTPHTINNTIHNTGTINAPIQEVWYGWTKRRDTAFWAGTLGNCLATVLGLAGGIPIAMALTRWQQREEEARTKADRDEQEKEATQRLLRLLRAELQHNLNSLVADAEQTAGGTPNLPDFPGLKDEFWRAVSDGGQIQHIRDTALLSLLAESYFRVRTLLFLEQRRFDAVYLYRSETAPKLREIMLDRQPKTLEQLQTTIEEIDRRLGELGE